MKDETYIGHTIHYRETNISFKNKRRIRKPQSEWVRVENTQEPIISEHVFPAGTGADSKPPAGTQKRYDTDFCGTDKVCGLRLVRWPTERTAEQQAYGYYHCSKNGQGTRQCSMHYIRYDGFTPMFSPVCNTGQDWYSMMKNSS